MKVLVLMGGDSPERDVSLVSGQAIAEGLKQAGYKVLAIDTAVSWDSLPGPAESGGHIEKEPPSLNRLQTLDSMRALKSFESADLKDVDVIFLALHGGKGEDGTIQALLDLTGKPYTGSGVLASALAMNKHMSKKIFENEGVLTPRWVLWDAQRAGGSSTLRSAGEKIGYPLVVKPNNQGSTVGVSIIDQAGQIEEAIRLAKKYSDQILVEEYIPGREITVAILDEKPLPVVEIVPEHGIYDYECKYTSGKSKYICPAELSSGQTREVQEAGLKAFLALGCQGYARVDFRMSIEGRFYCLEVNTLPGMTEHSLVPKAAQAAGIGFSELVGQIVRLAVKNKKQR